MEEHNVRLKQIQTHLKTLISIFFCFWEAFLFHSLSQLIPNFTHAVTYYLVYMPSQCFLHGLSGLVCFWEPSISKAREHAPGRREIPVPQARRYSYTWDQPWTHTALSSGIYRIVNCQRDVRLTPVTVFPLPSKSTSLKCPEISCLRGYSQLR